MTDIRNPLSEAPRNGTIILVHQTVPMRFLPYKPNSQQARGGTAGRWQEMNEYGGWDNCAPPIGTWEPDAQNAAARAVEEEFARLDRQSGEG